MESWQCENVAYKPKLLTCSHEASINDWIPVHCQSVCLDYSTVIAAASKHVFATSRVHRNHALVENFPRQRRLIKTTQNNHFRTTEHHGDGREDSRNYLSIEGELPTSMALHESTFHIWNQVIESQGHSWRSVCKIVWHLCPTRRVILAQLRAPATGGTDPVSRGWTCNDKNRVQLLSRSRRPITPEGRVALSQPRWL